MLGTTKRDYEWDWAGAEREYQRSLQLNPNDAHARDMYGIYLALMKRFEEAQAQFSQAHALDPLNLDNSNNLGFNLYVMRQYDRAIEAYKKTIDLDPNFVMAHRELGMVYSKAGLHDKAVVEAEKAVSLSRDPYTLAMLGSAYAAAGEKGKARKILEELHLRSRDSYVSPYYFGDIHAALGERDEAFRWFEKAYEERAVPLLWARVDPRFDPLRDDPRFQSLMHRIFPNEPPPAGR